MPFDLSTAKPVSDARQFDLSTAKPVGDSQQQASTFGPLDAIKASAADLYRGVASVPNMFLDIPANLHNVIAPNSPPWKTESQKQNEALAALGIKSDPSRVGQVISAVNRGIGSAATGLGIGGVLAGAESPVAAGVGRMLTTNPGTQLASAVTGSASSDIARQNGFGPLAQVGAGIVGSMVPPLITAAMPSLSAAPSTAREQVMRDAQAKGYAVPPGEQSALGSLAEGMGGKIKTQQLASSKNQDLTNQLSAAELGLPADTPLTPELVQRIRKGLGEGYRAIRGAGLIGTDDKYINAVESAAKPFQTINKDFPGMASGDVLKVAKAISQPHFEADSAVDVIQNLRDRATAAFRAGSSQEGAAYKSMANAVEDVIERDLESKGGDAAGILSTFRQARQAIAKTHTVEDALVGSTVDARALGRMLKNGAPLSGDLRLIARFAQEYPKATQPLRESIPAYSPLDWVTALTSGGAALMSRNPALAAGAAYAASRPAVRSFALSPMGQQFLTRPPNGFSVPWAATPGMLGPMMVNPAVQNQQP